MTSKQWIAERVEGILLPYEDIDKVIDDLAACEKEFADYKCDCCATHEADNEEYIKLESRLAKMRKVLEDYGWHSGFCPKRWGSPTEDLCTCGFDAALAEGG